MEPIFKQILNNQSLLEQQIKSLENQLHTISDVAFSIYDSMLDTQKVSRNFVNEFKEKFSQSNYIQHFQELDKSIQDIKSIHMHIQQKMIPEANEIVISKAYKKEMVLSQSEDIIQQPIQKPRNKYKQVILSVPEDVIETAGCESIAPAVALDSDEEDIPDEDPFNQIENAAETLLVRVKEGIKELDEAKRPEFQNKVLKFVTQISEQVGKGECDFERKRGVWQTLERITEIVK
ncbi:hypothetical protein SS50377_26168 [Spironucleus salmonicida]|uniref:Uncharacterized protein n=1 Tax=Spironucleus salmonicida TaxID=348837 RepID=V6LMG9_9EUKA|nr:hypothetical protein SS50377_26168 [Spironucleus salmonicida]|eukprot:EST44901.1 Hypothetical protein SS50377_15195 [Spironucleus salmonicida]